jgi:2-keto-4-pentenoate hydratase/2-oxohepta-3-ene-1,7-dioic acid hydratase in catechol pathway
MRLYTFEFDNQQRIGAEQNGRLIDISAAHMAWLASQGAKETPLSPNMLSLLKGGEAALRAARQAVAYVTSSRVKSKEQLAYSFDDVRLLAPIPRPGKILCAGVNYLSHIEENPEAKLPEEPFFFSKLPSAVIGPGQPIVHPSRKLTQQVDYEVEFAVVIGRTIRRMMEEEIMGCIAGYTILHDVSARDVQFKDHQITLGKNFDTFAPMGPCIVTKDELPDPGNCRLRTTLNRQVMQDGSTKDWLFPLPRLLSFLSQVMMLEPGDVISTGTPAGVGVFRQPKVFLQPGDRVVLEIEGIGRLENPVVSEE